MRSFYLLQFYGMTEFAVATMRPLSDYEENIHRLEVLENDHQLKPESVGQLCPMNQLKVIYFKEH